MELLRQELIDDGREVTMIYWHSESGRVMAGDVTDIQRMVTANATAVPGFVHRRMNYRGARRVGGDGGVIIEISFVLGFVPSDAGEDFPFPSGVQTFEGQPGAIAGAVGVDFGLPPNRYMAFMVCRVVPSTVLAVVNL